MGSDKDTLFKERSDSTDHQVLLEEILRLERAVGLIDGRREGFRRTLEIGLPILIFLVGLIGFTAINARIEAVVTERVQERVDDIIDSVAHEMLVDDKFQSLVSERIDSAAKVVVDQAEQAADAAEKAVQEAVQAVDDAEIAVLEANQAVVEAEGAADTAKEASDSAQDAAVIAEAVATQTADEAP